MAPARIVIYKMRIAHFCIVVLLLLIISESARAGKFRLDGNIGGINGGSAVLKIVSFSEAEKPVSETAVIKHGQFTFRGTLNSPMLSEISILPGKMRMMVFLEAGDIKVSGNVKDTTPSGTLRIKVIGSKSHQEYQFLASFKSDEIDSVFYLSRMIDGASNLSLEEYRRQSVLLNSRIHDLNELITKNNIEFIQTHLNSAVSAYYLILNDNYSEMPFDRLKAVITGFGPTPRSTPYYQRIKEEFAVLARIQPGEIAPEFSLNNPIGQPIALTSLKGKYVLIDFWASWCYPCRQSFPRVKELYSRYRDRNFEILGVSLDSKKGDWLKAISDDHLTWPQVIDESSIKSKHVVGRLYAIRYIPTAILVDKKGNIVARNLDDKELEGILDRVLDK